MPVKNQGSETPPVTRGFSGGKTKQKDTVDKHSQKQVEVGGPKGPEPTRYGDWEKAGRCTDF